METLWLVVAFGLGYIAKRIGLPPMIGFLISGFVLSGFGVESGEDLEEIANLGILLLLFSIGLKLKVKELLQPIVWAGTTIHMLLSVVVLGSLLFTISLFGLSEILDLELPPDRNYRFWS